MLLNARRRHRLDHSGPAISGLASGILLNARRRHRLDHSRPARDATNPIKSAQRPEASSSRSLRPAIGGRIRRGLLDARRRHRLDHRAELAAQLRPRICSTPGGVIVSITAGFNATRHRMGSAQRPEASSSRSQPVGRPLVGGDELLNARRRHRLDHPPVRREGDRTLPLLNARRRHRLDHFEAMERANLVLCCSTPGGVIVSITRRGGGETPREELLNARRRHRLDHAVVPGPPEEVVSCSTPGGVIVSITPAHGATQPRRDRCSTPGGVIVSITSPCPPRSSR